jgi:N-acetylmuramoyl-L-alanine amidase
LIRKLVFSICLTSIAFGYDVDNRNIHCMTQAIYHEARGESHLGRLAVGHVILNRIILGYGKTPCEVISQKRQFSWYGKGYTVREKEKWILCHRLSKQILLHKTKDPTNGSVFFHEKTINPNWKYKRVGVIDNHIFYKK